MLRKQIDFDGLLCYLNELSQIEIIKETELLDNFVGIKNFGCICYMNSILQQFFMIKKFREIVLNQSWS